jgi:hypothetical protein
MKTQRTKQLMFWTMLFVLLIPSSVVLAEDDPPPDPGAGSGQDALIGDGVIWTVSYYDLYYFTDTELNIAFDWNSFFTLFSEYPGLNTVSFFGTDTTTLDGSGNVYVNYVAGTDETECNAAWITPGAITLTATKDFPDHAVVVGQDPLNTGVDLTWILHINPTVFNYEAWVKIPPAIIKVPGCKGLQAECAKNQSGKPCCGGLECVPYNPSSGNGKCQIDWDLATWECVVKSINYPEDIAEASPSAVLTQPSRTWVLGELAMAYPGAYLKHPVWGFHPGHTCTWAGDVCVWTHTEGEVQVADPGYYDLRVSGMTAGTAISPPRTFSLVGGQFGVYLIDFSMTSP